MFTRQALVVNPREYDMLHLMDLGHVISVGVMVRHNEIYLRELRRRQSHENRGVRSSIVSTIWNLQ